MNDSTFWLLVDRTREASAENPARQAESLQSALEAMPEADIVAFTGVHRALANAAYDWNLWAAAFAIGGGCDDDGFDGFCDWIVSRGEHVYRAALADPASLAPLFASGRPDDGRDRAYQTGIFWPAAWAAYETKTGRELPAAPPAGAERRASEPAGIAWEVEMPDRLFPTLAALRSTLPGSSARTACRAACSPSTRSGR